MFTEENYNNSQNNQFTYNEYEKYDDNYHNTNQNQEKEPKNYKTIIIVLILLILIILGIFIYIKISQKNNIANNNEIRSLYLENDNIVLDVGEEKNINIIIDANVPNSISLDWTSSNNSIATVSNGKITAIAPGKTTIKATHITKKGKIYSDECEVIVYEVNIPIDDQKPICTFSNPKLSSIRIGTSTSYTLTCTDNSNTFNDSIITEEDFTYSNSEIITIELTKNEITNGLSYTINVKGNKVGKTNLSLKEGVISDLTGNINNSVTSKDLTITNQDATKPSCVFSVPERLTLKVGESITYTLTCTDNSNNIKDSSIDEKDFTYSNNDIVSINITKDTITNGFKYTINVTGKKAGNTTLSLKSGAISDSTGNINNSVTSANIQIQPLTCAWETTTTTGNNSCTSSSMPQNPVNGNSYVECKAYYKGTRYTLYKGSCFNGVTFSYQQSGYTYKTANAANTACINQRNRICTGSAVKDGGKCTTQSKYSYTKTTHTYVCK